MEEPKAGERLFALRERLGFSQRQLAKEFKVSAAAIALWENGARAVPGPVERLMELYEHYLNGNESDSSILEIRKVSTSWTKILLATIDLRKRKKLGWDDHVQKQIESILRRELSNESWKRSIQLNALERVVQTIGEGKGLPMKLAQLSSYLDLGIPQEFRDTLSTLQFLSSPMSRAVAARVFFEEFDQRPDECFERWNPTPFAAASIGQVHLAIGKAGDKYAVKVQYPGIRESLEKDLRMLERFTKVGSLLKRGDPEALSEVKLHVLKECDYGNEAKSQEDFRRYFADHPAIVVPKVCRELSSKRILTQHYQEGLSFQEFIRTASQDEKRVAASNISRFYMHGFFLSGLLHTDPHPGNFLFQGSKVVVLDYGRTTRLTPAESLRFYDIWKATINGDKAAAREVLRSMDVVRDWHRFDFDAFWNVTRAVHVHYLEDGAFEMTADYVRNCMKTMREFPQKREIRSPSAFFWGNIVHLSLWNILGALGAKSNWREDMDEISAKMNTREGRFLSHWNN